ncbi:hypothetical protein LTS10_006265 [Elasticomyces elasticus]|nr:hypothetical protein LTS10_006265 [Elasticomyces elasticus]
MAFQNSPLLMNTGLVVSVLPIGLGSLALFSPHYMFTKMFEFPLPASKADQAVALNNMRSFGIRDIFMGGACLGAWYKGDKEFLGYLLLLGAGAATVDGFAQKGAVGHGQWTKHWMFVPVMAGTMNLPRRREDRDGFDRS